MEAYVKALHGAKKGDIVTVVEYDEDNRSWDLFIEIKIVSLHTYPMRLEYTHEGMSITNYVNLDNLLSTGINAIFLRRTIPEDIIFQCSLSGNYVEAVKYHGYDTYETA